MTFEEYIKTTPKLIQVMLEQTKKSGKRLDYHPEGTLYAHIKTMWERLKQTNDINLELSATLHDICKWFIPFSDSNPFTFSYRKTNYEVLEVFHSTMMIQTLSSLTNQTEMFTMEDCVNLIKIGKINVTSKRNPNRTILGDNGEIFTYWSNHTHAKQAFQLIEGCGEIQNWIIDSGGELEKVKGIVLNHMRNKTLHLMGIKKQNKFLVEIEDYAKELNIFTKADRMLEPFVI